MKKIFSILLVLILCSAFLFAEAKEDFLKDYSNNPNAYTNIGKKFKPTNAVFMGMGGAGVALLDGESAIFYNPASLSEGRFKLSVPSVGVTLYHPSAFLEKDSSGKSLVDKIKDGENVGNLVTPILTAIGTSFAPLLKVDAAVSLSLPLGLGVGVYTSDTIYTYSGTIINEIDASVALGYAYKFRLGSFNISTGASARFNALAFNRRIDGTEIASAISKKDYNMDLVVASGWAPLVDLGVTAEWKGLSMAVVLSDINLTGYKLQIDETTLSNITKSVLTFDKNEDLKIKGTPDLTFGFGYTLDTSIFSLRAALDLTDCIPLLNGDVKFNKRTLLKRVNAGLELGLFDTVMVRGGLNSGYYTVGASFDLFVFRVDAAYYWIEMGESAGERGLDGLTIRFNLGYNR